MGGGGKETANNSMQVFWGVIQSRFWGIKQYLVQYIAVSFVMWAGLVLLFFCHRKRCWFVADSDSSCVDVFPAIQSASVLRSPLVLVFREFTGAPGWISTFSLSRLMFIYSIIVLFLSVLPVLTGAAVFSPPCWFVMLSSGWVLLFVAPPLLLAPDPGAASSAVTCGSVLKLLNPRHSVRLHSHDVRYGSGSGQQSVTGVTSVDDGNSYWRIRGKMDTVCERGTAIRCGQIIRITHVNTGRNLHSHHFTSPLSGNQEVSAFGDGGEGDYLDDWTVLCSEDYWERDSEVRFRHTATDVYLSVTGEQYGRPINGQREVHGMISSSQNNYWKAMEGIFMKPSEQQRTDLNHSEL